MDGASPPQEVIAEWLEIVFKTFDDPNVTVKPCIAVHCVAGLGR